jgi:hypothetical protein
VRVEAQRILEAVESLGVVTIGDGLALELTAAALAEYRAAVRILIRRGASYECRTASGGGMRRARPEQAFAADAWRRALAGLRDFGLTPRSRNQIEIDPPLATPATAPQQAHRGPATGTDLRGPERFFTRGGAA